MALVEKGLGAQLAPIGSPDSGGCEVCRETSKRLWTCIQCGHFSFCDDCWVNERPHRKGARGFDNRPHEKVDPAVVERLERIFGEGRTENEQVELFASSENTMWFGVDKTMDGSFLEHSDRLLDIMFENDKLSASDRFPQLVSFVGKTGEGKSTVIQMLIGQAQASIKAANPFPAPVNGLVDNVLPTSGDVHLYADPNTHHDTHPVLFADCEGLSGGESTPRAKECQDKKLPSRKRLKQRLRWARDGMTSSRGFAVKRLFPRILYTFSDVVVFVIQDARRFQSDVLVTLVEWAFFSIEKSINQPVLPHLIITLNRTDNSIDDKKWDPKVATDDLLEAHEDITTVPELMNIVQRLNRSGQNVRSAKQLLECFYRSITVVRIPAKGRYMQIDNQINKLYTEIRRRSTQSHHDKKLVRMALSAEKVHQFMSSAYNHFSEDLDSPFDFVKQALFLNPMPRDFEGHMLNLILAVRNAQSDIHGRESELKILGMVEPLLASCMALIITRRNLAGDIDSLLESTFHKPVSMAFEALCERWLPCGFRYKSKICCNVKFAHVKGHQDSDGKIFHKGGYQPRVGEADFEIWFSGIGAQLNKMMKGLPQAMREKEAAWTAHLQLIERFYADHPRLSEDVNHGTCFCCINNIPEHVLPCGHVLCAECATAFGGGRIERGVLTIRYCPFDKNRHKWAPVQLKFKPDGAGIRVLSLDGGGVRGFAELILLEELQQKLGGIPIQNFFDLIVGTSTGGIIALGLGVKNMPVSECMVEFQGLCKKAFTPRVFKRLWSSWYKTKPLKEGVQRLFGPKTLLFGGAWNGPRSHIKVAVTSSWRSGKSNKAVLFTNYNVTGPERETPKLNYEVVRCALPKQEMTIWEAALATSAAPPYFKPYTQKVTGKSFVDGGLHHNCPAWIAHHERQALWKDVRNRQPDIVLSIGTGLGADATAGAQNPQQTPTMPTQKTTTSGFGNLFNIIRGMVQSQLDSEQAWDDYYARATTSGANEIEDQRRHIRLNFQFNGLRPGLDNVDQLDSLAKTARDAAREPLKAKLQETVDRLVASSFYFERESLKRGGRSTGFIHCRFDPGSPDAKRLGKLVKGYIQEKFEPHFMLQMEYDLQRNDYSCGHRIEVPRTTWSELETSGAFELPVEIPKIEAHSDLVRLSMCLRQYQPSYGAVDPYFSISGFPRQLFDDNSRFAMGLQVEKSVRSKASHSSLAKSGKETIPPVEEKELGDSESEGDSSDEESLSDGFSVYQGSPLSRRARSL